MNFIDFKQMQPRTVSVSRDISWGEGGGAPELYHTEQICTLHIFYFSGQFFY